MSYAFRVYGDPEAQPRPRATTRRFGNTVRAGMYDCGSADGWKALIKAASRQSMPRIPLDGPIRVDIDFLFDRPQRLLRKKSPAERIRHTGKPDRDNCDKAVLDALTDLGWWKDDAQVCEGEPRKFYVAKGERPGAEIRISPLEPVQVRIEKREGGAR